MLISFGKQDDSASKIAELNKKIDDLSLEIKELKSKYVLWLEEKEIYVKELKNRIEKKIDYVNKKDTNASLKDLYKMKLAKKLGILPNVEAELKQIDNVGE